MGEMRSQQLAQKVHVTFGMRWRRREFELLMKPLYPLRQTADEALAFVCTLN